MFAEVLRRRNTRKLLLLGVIGLVIIFVGTSMMFAKNAYDSSFPRCDKPQFSGYLRYSDVEADYARTVVHFQSGKNKLTGYFYGEENDKGLVVISHGLGGGAENYLAETMYFVDQGWRVFAFDNTGSHASEGSSTKGLPQSLLDLDAALTYVEGVAACTDLPVMLYGHSWGGYAVCAVLNYGHDVAAVASIAGFNAPSGLLAEQLHDMMGAGAYAAYPFAWAYQAMLFGQAAGATAVAGINAGDTPVLIIHGAADDVIRPDGAGIIAQRDKITNPNAIFQTASQPEHDGHNNLFLSAAAVEYKAVKNAEYKALYDRYDGAVPDDVKATYYAGVDRLLVNQLDPDFMSAIDQFFSQQGMQR